MADDKVHVAAWRDAIENDPTMTIFRITFIAILLLTGCGNEQAKDPVVGQIQQIESPLQNTAEGMAKAKAFTEANTKAAEPERSLLSNLPMENTRTRNPVF